MGSAGLRVLRWEWTGGLGLAATLGSSHPPSFSPTTAPLERQESQANKSILLVITQLKWSQRTQGTRDSAVLWCRGGGVLSSERGPASHRRASRIDTPSNKAPTAAGWSVAPQTSCKYLVLKTLSSSGKKNHLDKMLFLPVRDEDQDLL